MSDFIDTHLTPALLLLADWSLRWGVVIAALALVLWRCPPRQVATRLQLCRLVLVGGLLLPLLPRWWGPTQEPPQPPASLPSPVAVSAGGGVRMPSVPAEVFPVPAPPPAEPFRPVTSFPVEETPAAPLGPGRWLVLAAAGGWLAGFLVGVLRLTLAWAGLARLRRSAVLASPAAHALLADCRAELAVQRAADLLTHPAAGAPVLLGGVRPAILLPPNWDALPADERRAALLHELAHLAGRDHWAKPAEELVRAAFFFHPLVHWLLNRLDGERERLCDAAVVRQGVAPRQFARVLLACAQRLGAGRPAVAALPFFNRLTVKDRIHQLLEDDMARWCTPPSRGRRAALAAGVLGAVIGLGGFGVRASGPAAVPETPSETPNPTDEPAAAVSGVVQDNDGRPVNGAVVIFGNWRSQDKSFTTRSGPDGRYAFPSFPANADRLYAMKIVAGKEGYAPAVNYISSDRTAERNHNLVLQLDRPATITGSVRDQAGRPVAGARVFFGTVQKSGQMTSWGYPPAELFLGTPLESFFTARTDAQGRFRFTTVPAGRQLIFRVEADGMADLDTAANGPRPEYFAKPDTPPLALVLAREGRINGRVMSRVSGAKVGGAHVWLQAAGGNLGISKQTWTDASGRFTLTGLPEGTFNVLTDEPPDGANWTVRAAPTVAVRPGAVAEVEIDLIEGVLVEGVVVAADTGRPVAGAAVALHGPARPPTSHAVLRAETDREGRYRFRLPPGETEFFVQAIPPGYTTPPHEENLHRVDIPTDVKTFPGPTLKVLRSTELDGRILDARGRPVPQARVVGLCRAGTCVRLGGPAVVADGQGRFRLEQGPDGRFPLGEATALQVELPGGQAYEVSTVVAAGLVEVRLPTVVGADVKGPADVRPDELAGVVVGEDGKPLEGVHVHVWDWVDAPENQTRTGKDGVFRIKDCGRDRKVQVRFRKPGYSPVMFVQQPPGVKDWVVAMNRRTYFEGVVRGPDGKPAAGARIRANQGPKQGDGVMITTIWTETTADASGRYRLDVEPDAYEFLVKAPGVGVARLPKTPVAHGQPRTFDIQLQPGITFRAVAVDAQTGQPVAGVRLWSWEHKGVEGRSDAKGEITIPEMLPGRFEFSVEAAGYARWWSDHAASDWNRRQLESRPGLKWQRNFDHLDFDLRPEMSPVQVVLEKGVRVTGRVVDPDGKPVAGATVAPALTGTGNSLTGDTRFSVATSADGTFAVVLPASGQAEYNLVAHDGKYGEWRKWANGVLRPVRTTPGQELRDVTLTLTRPATVRGKVVYAKGNPVAHREVRAHAADKLENRYYDPTTTTRADGTFELRFVRPGEHFIQAAPFWLAADDAPHGSTRKLRLTAGQTAEGVELVAADKE
jgi:protocatechuate 3,4-dioxygenase beta subunit